MFRLLLGVVACAAITRPVSAGAPDFFPEKEKDFGVSPKGTVLVHYFRCTNTTKDTITLGQPRVSCGCVTATLTKTTLAPGESGVVIAYMDTRRIPHAGVTKTVLIYVPLHSSRFEEVALKVTTVTRDDLMMSPDVIALGTVPRGKTATASTKVTFTSDANWKILKATSTGAFVSVEFQESVRSGSRVTYEVVAKLAKDCPVGNWICDIVLETSNTSVARLRIPVTVNVVPAAVAATPDEISFGKVKIGEMEEQKIVVEGKIPFKILEVRSAEGFRVKVDTNVAQAVHTIVVTADSKTPGRLSAQLEIVTDHKDQPTVIIPVKVIEK